MSTALESTMYTVAQLFLLPTLLLIAALFLYAFWVLGEFVMLALRRRQGAGRPLVAAHRAAGPSGLSEDELDLRAHKLMEGPRIASRVTPLLGLVATMIPMGPALKGLATRMDEAMTIAWIKDPTAKKPGAMMPKLYPEPLSEQAVKNVAAYVQGLK